MWFSPLGGAHLRYRSNLAGDDAPADIGRLASRIGFDHQLSTPDGL
jgi:hypothetical protein